MIVQDFNIVEVLDYDNSNKNFLFLNKYFYNIGIDSYIIRFNSKENYFFVWDENIIKYPIDFDSNEIEYIPYLDAYYADLNISKGIYVWEGRGNYGYLKYDEDKTKEYYRLIKSL